MGAPAVGDVVPRRRNLPGGTECDRTAKHGAAMTDANAGIGGFFGVNGLQRHGDSLVQRRISLVLGGDAVRALLRRIAAKTGLPVGGCRQSA